MESLQHLHIYRSPLLDPYYNLAAEQLLFDACPRGTMILYLWQNDKTVVIGKNQNPLSECDLPKMKRDGIHLARRKSGGGAVYHDKGNLNFSFICHSDDEREATVLRNMQIIASACAELGIEAIPTGRNDILAAGGKFSGNAFFHKESKTCHHGTLLIESNFDALSGYLTPSPLKLSAKGIKSVRSRVTNLSSLSPGLTAAAFRELLIKAAEKELCLLAEEQPFPDGKSCEAPAKLFGSDEWLFGKSAPYQIELHDKFPWGEVQLHLSIEKGLVHHAKMYTDAMDAGLSDRFEAALSGLPFQGERAKASLTEKLPSPMAEDLGGMLENIK